MRDTSSKFSETEKALWGKLSFNQPKLFDIELPGTVQREKYLIDKRSVSGAIEVGADSNLIRNLFFHQFAFWFNDCFPFTSQSTKVIALSNEETR